MVLVREIYRTGKRGSAYRQAERFDYRRVFGNRFERKSKSQGVDRSCAAYYRHRVHGAVYLIFMPQSGLDLPMI